MCGSMTHSYAERWWRCECSRNAIEDLVPLLYPGVKVSYGTIQHMLVEADQVFEAGALDEVQPEPVLAGVDLDSGYLFGLVECERRGRGCFAVRRRGWGCRWW